MTPEDKQYSSLPELDPEKLRMYRLARLAGKHNDDLHLNILGLKETAALFKRYSKAQKHVAEVGRAAGLEVMDGASMSGPNDPRAAHMAQAIDMVYPAGTQDNARMRAFTRLPPVSSPRGPVIAERRETKPGGVAYSIGLAPSGERINAAVASLGDRKGEPVDTIASDLRSALHVRFLDLPQEDIEAIAMELANGEEVVVQIVPDDQQSGVFRNP